MRLSFTKMQGLANDFIVLDGFKAPLTLSPAQVRAMADRRLGVGCDQVLVLHPGRTPAADAQFTIFNADGGEVAQCGNGARCAADFLLARGYVSGREVRLETGAGVIHVQAEGGNVYRVNMGVPAFEPARVPLRADRRQNLYRLQSRSAEWEFSAVSLGNPHAVLRVDDVDQADVEGIGRAFQGSGMFPQGINVGFMQVLNPGAIRLRVCERGVGETQACGSGACAAVIAGRINHGLAGAVDVALRGGRLHIQWKGEGEAVWMTGPAETVFEGSINL